MNTEFTLIKISDAPGHLPSGFTEEIYTDHRVKRMGVNEEKLLTSEKFKVLYDDKYEQRLVQAIVYDKYKLTFLKKENYNIELIQYANTIVVYDYVDNIEHHARILTLTTEPVNNTSFQKITIEYIDTNEDNYFNGAIVSNMLRSDSLITRFPLGGSTVLNTVSIAVGVNTYSFFSPFYSEQYIEAPVNDVSELEGKNIQTRIVQKYKRRLVLYCNNSDAVSLQYKGNISNGYNATMTFNEGTTYTGVEAPEIEVTKEPTGIDLYKIEIKLTTNVINFNPYSVTI